MITKTGELSIDPIGFVPPGGTVEPLVCYQRNRYLLQLGRRSAEPLTADGPDPSNRLETRSGAGEFRAALVLGARQRGCVAAEAWMVQADCAVTLTIQLVPYRSMHIPKIAPQGTLSNGTTTVPRSLNRSQ